MIKSELRQLPVDALRTKTVEERAALRALLFSAKQKQLKRVREIRRIRVMIAQLLTCIREKRDANVKK